MAHDKKLTKEILLNALGKTEDTPEVQKLFQILGQADIDEDTDIERQIHNGKRYTYVDAEDGTFIYAWDRYGIEMHLTNEDTYQPKKYPLSETPEVDAFFLYIKPDETEGRKSCLGICEDAFFYEGMKIDDIIQKYGESQRVWQSEKKNIGRHTYYDLEGLENTSIQFSYDLDTHEIFKTLIILVKK